MSLVDIGDFTGTGSSHAVFYASDESTIPVPVAEVYDLRDFRQAASATDKGY